MAASVRRQRGTQRLGLAARVRSREARREHDPGRQRELHPEISTSVRSQQLRVDTK